MKFILKETVNMCVDPGNCECQLLGSLWT